MNVRDVQKPELGAVSMVLGVMLHVFCLRQVVLTATPLAGSAPTQTPAAKGPVGQEPVGLP